MIKKSILRETETIEIKFISNLFEDEWENVMEAQVGVSYLNPKTYISETEE